MSSEKTVVVSGGTSIAGLLGIAFIVLKLCGVIAWPWIWVLAPFWIPVVAALACIICGLLIMAFVAICAAIIF